MTTPNQPKASKPGDRDVEATFDAAMVQAITAVASLTMPPPKT